MAAQERVSAKPDFVKLDTAGAVINGPLALVESYGDGHREKPGAVDYLEFTTPAEYWGWVESHTTHLRSRLYSTSLGGNHDKSSQ